MTLHFIYPTVTLQLIIPQTHWSCQLMLIKKSKVRKKGAKVHIRTFNWRLPVSNSSYIWRFTSQTLVPYFAGSQEYLSQSQALLNI